MQYTPATLPTPSDELFFRYDPPTVLIHIQFSANSTGLGEEMKSLLEGLYHDDLAAVMLLPSGCDHLLIYSSSTA
jgi:hypothetical protein